MVKKRLNFDNDPPIYRVLWALLGAVIGGFVVAFVTGSHLKVLPDDGVTYNDLAAVLLTAVGVLLTVFALAAGVAALWGYREFSGKMKDVATEVAEDVSRATIAEVAETEFAARREEASKEIAGHKMRFQEETDAVLADTIPRLEEAARAVAMRILTPEAITDIINKAIQAQLFGDPQDRELDREQALAEEEAEVQATAADAALADELQSEERGI
jgi:hypothetical protein